jgi:hypothetical protein
MGFPIIPLAVVGTALGSIGAYLYKDAKMRHRIAEEGRHLADTVEGYVGGIFAGGQRVIAEGINVMRSAVRREPDRVRCEALAKSGRRCRARTSKIMTIQDESGREQEYGLCWRHARVHEKGEPLALVKADEREPEPRVVRH